MGCHRGSLSGEGPRTQLMLIQMLRCHEVVLFLGGIVNTVEVFVFTFHSLCTSHLVIVRLYLNLHIQL